MSVHGTPSGYASSAPEVGGYAGYGEEDHGYGWVMFAGVLLLLVGTLNFIEGIAAIGNAHFFTHNANYVFGSLNAWGWTVLIIGAIQLAVGFGVFAKNQLSRWIGVIALACNALAQLLMIPAYPFWSLTLVALDILAIYGLVAYGKRISQA
jgi:hypothetical protein